MKSQILWVISGFMLLVFTGCATMSEDELDESGMIPPSANYSPMQAPVYPPLNQPYSPNLLNDNDGRVMNIDRLNVGEANLPMPTNQPNMQQQNGNSIAQNGTAQNGNGNYETYEETTSDYTQEYVPSYIAPSEVVPYEQVLPAPQDSQIAGNQPYPNAPLANGQLPNGQLPNQYGQMPQNGQYPSHTNGLIPPAPIPNPNIANDYGANQNAYPYPMNPANPVNPVNPQGNQLAPNGACLYEPCPQVPERPKAPTMPPLAEQPQMQKQEPKVPNIIPNSPLLESENVIELSAVGMGVAPESTISPSQALALAKRAAIIDAYRQIGEKMYGIKINGKDTVKDMVLSNSVVKAQVEALIKNADIVETIYKDGLCQVTMELKLDSRTWNRILATNG